METNSANIDSSQSVHEYSDMRRPTDEYCEMLNQSNDEIDQLNRHSTNPEFIELYYAPSEHQYERVPYSTIEQNEDKSTVNLKVIKQVFIVVLVAVIIVTLVLLCVILGKYISNMFSENRDLSKESNSKNKSDSVTTIPTSSSTVASTSRQEIISKSVSSIKSTTTQTVLPRSTQKKENTLDEKLEFVKEMMLDSWNAYEQYAWGHGEVNPVQKKVYDDGFGDNSGLTLVTSMSTLWIMGLEKEFNRGKQWIEAELDLSKVDKDFQVYNVIVNYIGGLLSCYALTNEQLFMNKALTIAQLVEPAFNTSKGLPYQRINLKTSKLPNYYTYLSRVSGFQLDFNYLSDASGNEKYRKQIEKIQNVLNKIKKPKNRLYLEMITIEGRFNSDYSSLFWETREFYISLVKSYIQSNHLDVQSIEMYKEAMDAVEAVKMFEVSPNGLYYARVYILNTNTLKNYMQYSGCYLGAMLSLGASAMQRALALNSSIGDKDKVTQQNRINRHWHLAIQITRTCQLASDRTKTGLGPAEFYFNQTHDAIAKDRYYGLSSELAESNFILWRLTGNETYRNNAWKMAQAIHQHCRVEGGGYARIKDVNREPTSKDDRQPAQFLSATLKYLYLTFTSDSVLPLDQWVFNSVGHPLPICGNNTMYPTKLCKH